MSNFDSLVCLIQPLDIINTSKYLLTYSSNIEIDEIIEKHGEEFEFIILMGCFNSLQLKNIIHQKFQNDPNIKLTDKKDCFECDDGAYLQKLFIDIGIEYKQSNNKNNC